MNQKEAKNRCAARAGLLALALLPAFLLLVRPAGAQDERAERELEAARQRVRQLMQESEELRHKAEQLQAEIAARTAHTERAAAQQEREHAERARQERVREADAELVEILEGLEHGMVALERIGKRDLLDMLGRVADDVRAKRKALHGERDVIGIGAAPGRRRGGDEDRGEREAAMHQLDVMRIALSALREAERWDAAELLERAIRAREVNLEGRRDEEARAIRERAPDPAQLTEILLHAARLWDEFGHERKAAAVRELGEQFQVRLERGQAAAQQQRAAAERAEARAQRERRDEAAVRIERLEGRLDRVEGMLEEMHAMLEELRRRDR